MLAVAVAIAAGAAACGNGSEAAGPLSAQERSRVDGASMAIGRYCRQVGNLLSRRGRAPTAAETQAANEAVDTIAAVAREKPSAEYRPGQRMRDLVADAAENLEASNCSPQLVTRLEHALASLPPGD